MSSDPHNFIVDYQGILSNTSLQVTNVSFQSRPGIVLYRGNVREGHQIDAAVVNTSSTDIRDRPLEFIEDEALSNGVCELKKMVKTGKYITYSPVW